MSASNEEPMPNGVVINNEESGNAEVEKLQENNKDGLVVGGDIGVGNPPHENNNNNNTNNSNSNNNNLHAEDKETDKEGIPTPIIPTTTTTITIDESMDEEDLEAMRINSPTPIKNNADDGADEESPFPKRTSVFSGREHEDTDDFLLSTMLAIRTAVCFSVTIC